MRKLIAAALVTTAIGIGGATASADSCVGDNVGKDIASTWPFAHEDRSEFPPPPGAFALWVETFGFEGQPGAEIQALREFCNS